MPQQPATIGELRYRVTLGLRGEQQDPASTGLLESYQRIGEVNASITPTSAEMFIGSEQVGTPITHRIVFRWTGYEQSQFFDVIVRQLDLPNDTTRAEIFRVRRIQEFDGRQRFVVADVELEVYSD